MSRRNGSLLVLGIVCSFFLLNASSMPAAFAAKTVVNTIGGPEAGTTGGIFSNPRGVAVNQTGAGGVPAGTLYVVDGGNNRIQQFSPTGSFVRAWGAGVKDGSAEFQICTEAAKCTRGPAGNSAGALNNAQGVAVDRSSGNVYVTAQNGRRVNVFSPVGLFQGAFGWGAATSAAALEFCTTLIGCKDPGPAAPATGNVGGGQFGAQLGDVDVAPNGDIYVADKSSRRIQVFKPVLSGSIVTGVEFVRAFGWGAATGAAQFEVCTASPCNAPAAAGTGLGQFATNSPSEVVIDAAGNVYALDNGNKRVQKFSSTPEPLAASFGAPALTGAFGTGTLQNLATDTDTGNVLVAGARSTSANRIAALELDGAGDAVALQGEDLTIGTSTTGSGLAVANESLGGNVYVSDAGVDRVFVLNDTRPTIEPVTGVGAREATFNGQVVSNELETTYHFEYSTDGSSWTKVPVPDAVAGSAPGTIPVSQVATGLLPSTEYRVRLVGNRPNGGGSATSAESTFTTLPAKPTVDETFAAQIGDEDARLAAYLNPENAATTYYFEYGTTIHYGSTAPTPVRSAGDGTARVNVSAAISGLNPATTYHFRVVAENEQGTTVGPDATFTTLPPADGLPGRAFEMVSPPDKHGSNVLMPEGGAYNGWDFAPIASIDGDAVAFTSYGTFAGAKSHGVFTPYLATRSESGWSTESLAPPMRGANNGVSYAEVLGFSPDLRSRLFVGSKSPQLVPGASEWVSNAYVWSNSAQTYQLVTPGLPSKQFVYIQRPAYSEDLTKVYFHIVDGGALTENTPPGMNPSLYAWDAATGTLSYVAIEPESTTPFPTPARIASPYADVEVRAPSVSLWNPVSADGSKVYFETGAVRQLYVRIDDGVTQHVSKSVRAVVDPNGTRPSKFRWASKDGQVAFFTSAEKLTDDATTGPASAGSDLYRYELATKSLTDITVDEADPNGAEVQGVLGGSEDGSRLYFVARGVLAPGAVAGADNLYVWTDDGSAKGDLEFISTGVGSEHWEGLAEFDFRHLGRVTPSGEQVLFQTKSAISEFDNGGKYQVYVYNAEADRLQCASCNPTGAPAKHDSLALGVGDDIEAARLISDDGRLVFFSTKEGLVPEDTNGLLDTFAFNTETGKVELLSPGTGGFDAPFLDASASGRDVFFGTRQKLVGIDTDDNIDVYDARVGGGLSAQNPPLVAPCFGEACRPAPVGFPATTTPASESVSGRGNQKPDRKKNRKAKGKKGKGKGKKAKGKKAKGKNGKGKKGKGRDGRPGNRASTKHRSARAGGK